MFFNKLPSDASLGDALSSKAQFVNYLIFYQLSFDKVLYFLSFLIPSLFV